LLSATCLAAALCSFAIIIIIIIILVIIVVVIIIIIIELELMMYLLQLLDMWHPLERAQYPEYFARRHQRKLEYIERWEKKYGKAENDKKSLEAKYGRMD